MALVRMISVPYSAARVSMTEGALTGTAILPPGFRAHIRRVISTNRCELLMMRPLVSTRCTRSALSSICKPNWAFRAVTMLASW
ncbi:hypothetical protein D3C72_2348050 [compost metagenome]